MNRGKDNFQFFLAHNDLRAEYQSPETCFVNIVKLRAETYELTLLRFRERFINFTCNLVDLIDDRPGLRLDDLCSVRKVDLVTIVMWRIMARRDHNPCRGVCMANGE